jgi:hypothetical protein
LQVDNMCGCIRPKSQRGRYDKAFKERLQSCAFYAGFLASRC